MSEVEIWEQINRVRDQLTTGERRFWDLIQIEPEKWRCSPWGDETGGFWAVGIIGKYVIWYNELEYGFNCTQYMTHGVVHDYQCHQWELEDAVRSVKAVLDGISNHIPYCGPPKPIQG